MNDMVNDMVYIYIWLMMLWLVVNGCHEFGIFPINIGFRLSSQVTNSIIFQRGGEKPPTSEYLCSTDWLQGKSTPETIDFPVKHGCFLFLFPLNQTNDILVEHLKELLSHKHQFYWFKMV